MSGIINLHIYSSPFKFESRILRETKSIIEQGLAEKVIIASGWSTDLLNYEQIDEKRSVKRFKLFFKKYNISLLTKCLSYFEFIIKVFIFYHKKQVRIVNCHSLFVLPIGYFLKLVRPGIWLIYDAHELETQKAGLNKVGKVISSFLERLLIKKVDRLIVVSPSIAKWYDNKYGLSDIIVIRNVPGLTHSLNRSRIFNDMFNIPDNCLIFIYQGVINKGRGIELLINTFREISHDKHLVIMGFGPLVSIVKTADQNYLNIHFLPAVPPVEIMNYTSGADIGLSMIENISLSYYFCLPNKLFEYLHCGIPVVVSDFPDMGDLVRSFDCGWVSEVNLKDFKEMVSNISSESINKKRLGVLKAREVLNWEKESRHLSKSFPLKK